MSDINNPNYNPDYVEYDPTAEAPESRGFVPISDGSRTYQLSEGTKGIEIRKSRAGNNYINAHIVGTVTAGPDAGRKVSFWFNEFGRKDASGKARPSDLHNVCTYGGVAIQPKMTREELVQAVKEALVNQPEVKIYTRWEATVKGQDGKRKVLAKGQKAFPSDGEGGYIPELVITAEHAAQFNLDEDLIGQTLEADLAVFMDEPTRKTAGA